jgi:hypothetical protein
MYIHWRLGWSCVLPFKSYLIAAVPEILDHTGPPGIVVLHICTFFCYFSAVSRESLLLDALKRANLHPSPSKKGKTALN